MRGGDREEGNKFGCLSKKSGSPKRLVAKKLETVVGLLNVSVGHVKSPTRCLGNRLGYEVIEYEQLWFVTWPHSLSLSPLSIFIKC